MTNPRHRTSLEDELAQLPRRLASTGFTERTLAALEQRAAPGRGSGGRLVWATTAALLLVALLAVGSGYLRQRAADRAYRQQVEELKTRYQELLTEVARVRQQAAGPDTRIYLGGDERLDLVLDLARLDTQATAGHDVEDIRPANWEP